MQNKSFIFWLFNKDKKPLYFDKIVRESNGILKPDGQPAHLEYAPDGWKDILVKYGRNIKYLGLFRDFTVPMNFKRDGARIVKDAMWKLGMEAVIYLGVSKLNRKVYPPKYEPWYSGELDFSKTREFKKMERNIRTSTKMRTAQLLPLSIYFYTPLYLNIQSIKPHERILGNSPQIHASLCGQRDNPNPNPNRKIQTQTNCLRL